MRESRWVHVCKNWNTFIHKNSQNSPHLETKIYFNRIEWWGSALLLLSLKYNYLLVVISLPFLWPYKYWFGIILLFCMKLFISFDCILIGCLSKLRMIITKSLFLCSNLWTLIYINWVVLIFLIVYNIITCVFLILFCFLKFYGIFDFLIPPTWRNRLINR